MILHDQLKNYSSLVWEPEDIIEIRPLPSDKGYSRRWIKAKELPDICEALKRDNIAGANIYAGVLPRSVKGKGTAEFCEKGKAIWADFDGVDPREAWKKCTSAKLPEPSMVINSGHGAHVFWALSEKQDQTDISKVVRDLAELVQSDPSVHDLARILRLPGFVNWKEPKATAELLFCNSKAIYSFSQIRAAIPEMKAAGKESRIDQNKAASPEEIVERARKYIERIPGSAHPGRSDAAYKVATALVRDFKLPEHEAIILLAGWDAKNNTPPIDGDPAYGDHELEAILTRAQKYGKHAPGSAADKQLERKDAKIQVSCDPASDIEDMLNEIESQKAGESNTVPLPWQRLSWATRALKPGAVFIIAGPTKVGKSFFTTNIAMHLQGLGVSWKYLPLEDSKTAFLWRILAVATNDYSVIDDDQEFAYLRKDIFEAHKDELAIYAQNIAQNPRLGKKDKSGNTIIPEINYSKVVEWAREALKTSRVIFIDPISMIDFTGEKYHNQEADLVKNLLGLAADSKGTIVLIAHTVKRQGAAASLPLTDGDVQGSVMLTRLSHTTVLIEGHENRVSRVCLPNIGMQDTEHNRTITVAAARNGPGTRNRYAFIQGTDGPIFEELGQIHKKEKTNGRA